MSSSETSDPVGRLPGGRLFLILTALLCLPDVGAKAADNRTLYVRSVYTLDEPRKYCFELRGDGNEEPLTEPVRAHSCTYQSGNDMGVDAERIRYDRIGFKKNIFCLEAREGTTPGARIYPTLCSDMPLLKWAFPPDKVSDSPTSLLKDPLQRWKFTMGFGIVPRTDMSMCITMGEDPGVPTGRQGPDGVPELSRPLTLEKCAAKAVRRQRWYLTEG